MNNGALNTANAAAGAEAARRLLEDGIEAAGEIDDPLTPQFAAAVVEGLSAGMAADRRGWIRNIMEGTGRLARNLNVEPEHGLIEVVQNADDLGATVIRFVLVPGPPRRLLVVHDGDRVRAPHVLAMTLALVSTKGDDTIATGKFGIGLKTLTRLADAFEVHSPPYSFLVVDQRLAAAGAHEPLPSIWDSDRPETLLALALNPDYPDDGLRTWFEGFGADSLLFLGTVRQLELRSPSGDLLATHELVDADSREITLDLGDDDQVPAREHRLHEPAAERTWVRVAVEREPDVSDCVTVLRRDARHVAGTRPRRFRLAGPNRGGRRAGRRGSSASRRPTRPSPRSSRPSWIRCRRCPSYVSRSPRAAKASTRSPPATRSPASAPA